LEELKPLEEAQEAVLMRVDPDLDLDPAALDLLTHHKAQALRTAKVAAMLRDKLAEAGVRRGEDLGKMEVLKEELQSAKEASRQQTCDVEALKGRLRGREEVIRTLEGEVGSEEEEELRIGGLEGREAGERGLLELATEVDLAVQDVGRVVEVGRALM